MDEVAPLMKRCVTEMLAAQTGARHGKNTYTEFV